MARTRAPRRAASSSSSEASPSSTAAPSPSPTPSRWPKTAAQSWSPVGEDADPVSGFDVTHSGKWIISNEEIRPRRRKTIPKYEVSDAVKKWTRDRNAASGKTEADRKPHALSANLIRQQLLEGNAFKLPGVGVLEVTARTFTNKEGYTSFKRRITIRTSPKLKDILNGVRAEKYKQYRENYESDEAVRKRAQNKQALAQKKRELAEKERAAEERAEAAREKAQQKWREDRATKRQEYAKRSAPQATPQQLVEEI